MAARALQFLAMTVARSGEVRGMTWAEVDLDKALWIVPAARMKAGREHRVPLTREAVELLRTLPRMAGSPYVFFAPQGGMLSDMTLSAVMRRMQEAEEKAGRAGYLDPRSGRPAVPHGLRSTFRDWAAEQGFDRDMAEDGPGAQRWPEVERAYRRTDMLERRRAMLEAWGRFLPINRRQTSYLLETEGKNPASNLPAGVNSRKGTDRAAFQSVNEHGFPVEALEGRRCALAVLPGKA